MVRESSATFEYIFYSKHIEDWEQVKKWSLLRQLKERGRVFGEILRARQELTKAHFQILYLDHKIRKGKLAPEDIERLETLYRRYIAAMDALEHYTGRSSNTYSLLRIFA
jgi:hypothetical protein